ncbi:MAG: hypothetical protein LBF41_00250 [Deltaproteobacteria bacterium]|jgi:hypothetical protein|nr:hypothetical protein [Deltaproteobacteria bacterium]
MLKILLSTLVSLWNTLLFKRDSKIKMAGQTARAPCPNYPKNGEIAETLIRLGFDLVKDVSFSKMCLPGNEYGIVMPPGYNNNVLTRFLKAVSDLGAKNFFLISVDKILAYLIENVKINDMSVSDFVTKIFKDADSLDKAESLLYGISPSDTRKALRDEITGNLSNYSNDVIVGDSDSKLYGFVKNYRGGWVCLLDGHEDPLLFTLKATQFVPWLTPRNPNIPYLYYEYPFSMGDMRIVILERRVTGTKTFTTRRSVPDEYYETADLELKRIKQRVFPDKLAIRSALSDLQQRFPLNAVTNVSFSEKRTKPVPMVYPLAANNDSGDVIAVSPQKQQRRGSPKKGMAMNVTYRVKFDFGLNGKTLRMANARKVLVSNIDDISQDKMMEIFETWTSAQKNSREMGCRQFFLERPPESAPPLELFPKTVGSHQGLQALLGVMLFLEDLERQGYLQ